MQTLHSEFTSIPVPPAADERNMVTPNRVRLWRLHGATDDLECAAVVTSYGYALCLELGGEPILLELQRSLELLTTDRILNVRHASHLEQMEAALAAVGKRLIIDTADLVPMKITARTLRRRVSTRQRSLHGRTLMRASKQRSSIHAAAGRTTSSRKAAAKKR